MAFGAGCPLASMAYASSLIAQATGSHAFHSSPIPPPYEPFAVVAASAASLDTCAILNRLEQGYPLCFSGSLLNGFRAGL